MKVIQLNGTIGSGKMVVPKKVNVALQMKLNCIKLINDKCIQLAQELCVRYQTYGFGHAKEQLRKLHDPLIILFMLMNRMLSR